MSDPSIPSLSCLPFHPMPRLFTICNYSDHPPEGDSNGCNAWRRQHKSIAGYCTNLTGKVADSPSQSNQTLLHIDIHAQSLFSSPSPSLLAILQVRYVRREKSDLAPPITAALTRCMTRVNRVRRTAEVQSSLRTEPRLLARHSAV